MNSLDQGISIVGALLILYAYFALQRGRMTRDTRSFNVLNLVGSALMTYVAVRQLNYGFILMEGSWALLSIRGSISSPKPARTW